jgi:hypothetical protein
VKTWGIQTALLYVPEVLYVVGAERRCGVLPIDDPKLREVPPTTPRGALGRFSWCVLGR